MKTQHTPGPWQIGYNATNPEGFYTIMDKQGIAICKTVNQSAQYAKHEGHNANIIAAAPEMLEALEKLLPKLSQLQDESAFTWPEKIENLINKAKGL